MQIIRPVLHASLLVRRKLRTLTCSVTHVYVKSSALAMAEQERIAGEEAEKRLKAALTAKREPASASRIASPHLGTPIPLESTADFNPAVEEASAQEDVSMEVEASVTPSALNPEVSSKFYMTYNECIAEVRSEPVAS